MLHIRRMTGWFALTAAFLGALGASCLTAPLARGQATLSTGSIQGTVVDQHGGAVSGAKVVITHKSTGQVFSATTNATGASPVSVGS